MKLNLQVKVFEFLEKNKENKFTAREIAEWIFNAYPKECKAKKERSIQNLNDSDLIKQILAEIGSKRASIQKNHPEIQITEGRPRKYYYSLQDEDDDSNSKQSEQVDSSFVKNNKKINEHDLYPLLSIYLFSEFNVYSKRIDEKRSSNSYGPNGNHWLHPDLVGLEILGSNWTNTVRQCADKSGRQKTKLWSFEVKHTLQSSNVRQSFFQAISNSSWAHIGYLVAGEIIGIETTAELRILSAAHGIGLIKLDIENPAESQIIIPARQKDSVDWNLADRLAQENTDFKDYLELVNDFYKLDKIRFEQWDIPKIEE